MFHNFDLWVKCVLFKMDKFFEKYFKFAYYLHRQNVFVSAWLVWFETFL